jgi:hypothetical protein
LGHRLPALGQEDARLRAREHEQLFQAGRLARQINRLHSVVVKKLLCWREKATSEQTADFRSARFT